MRKQIKTNSSKILLENIEYHPGGDNSKLRELLFVEQKGFCAYTETYLGRTDQKDIDHFNPTKDFIDRNKYHNLFLCKALWNKEKSNKWGDFQPMLNPCCDEFEDRVIFNKDLKIFEANNDEDIEAKNLVSFLKLDDPDLANERKRYLKRMKEISESYGCSLEELFSKIIEKFDFDNLRFIRSVTEEYGFDLWSMIPFKNDE